nr:non-ribosomal peptide synthase/polyketide synthase [Hoyosella rhizosphaerae]
MADDSSRDWDAWLAGQQDSFEPFPLQQAQYGMWFAQQLEPEVPVVVAQYMEFHGPIDVDLLERSLDQARCELGSGVLRIAEHDGTPMQFVDTHDHRNIYHLDLSHEDDPFAVALEWMHNDYSQPITLTDGPLGTSVFIRLADNHLLWYGRIHHIALDGYGATRWMNRSAELYKCALDGTEPPPPPFATLRSLYDADLAYRTSNRYEVDRDFWIERLKDWQVISSLVEGSAQAVPRTKLETAPLTPEAADRLENADQSFGVSAAAVLTAAFGAYLARMTGEADITVSTTMLGRVNRQQRASGGTFANIVPLRLAVDSGATMADLFQLVLREQLGALRHQRFSVEQIRNEIGLADSPRRLLGPIVNPMLFDQNVQFGDATGEFTILTSGPVEDLLINIYPHGAEARTHVDFRANPNLYTDELLAEHHGRFMEFLEEFLLADPETPLAEIHRESVALGVAIAQERAAERYWTSALQGLAHVVDIPGINSGSDPSASLRNATEVSLHGITTSTLNSAAAAAGVDTQAFLNASVAATLARLSDAVDISIANPTVPADNGESDASAYVIRLGVDTGDQLSAIARVADEAARAGAQFALPVAQLSKTVGWAVPPCHAVVTTHGAASVPAGLKNVPVVVSVRFDDAAVALSVDVAGDTHTADSVGRRIASILTKSIENPAAAIGDYQILDADELALLAPVNGPHSRTTRTLGQLFTDVAADNPDVDAIISGDVAVTYRQLDSHANQIARYILDRFGVQAEQLVAMGVSRSVESVTCTWAIAKTGAGFVPVDPNYPKDRVEHMLDDSGCVVGLTVAAQRDRLPDTIEWIVVDDPAVATEIANYPTDAVVDADRPSPVRLDNVAYVIYTSGSTGKPKGVAVTHHGLESYAAEERDSFDVTPGSRVLALSSPSFDASLHEMLFSLGNGVTMILVPTTVYGGDDLRAILEDKQVTHAFITPLALASVEHGGLEHLRQLAVGGEALPRELLAKWSEGHVFHNVYGPTETTIVTAISEPLTADDPISIGGPIRGTRMVILDGRMQPVPLGVPGELYISGLGLARGYHERFDLTSTRFVADPYGPAGARMYRSGDLARWAHAPRTNNLTIEYVGRSDFQVKVRGFRIELGEIDAVLSAHPSIGFAATLGVEGPSGDTVLVAYVKYRDGETSTTEDLQQHLGEFLPSHMVPTVFVPIAEVPLNPVGKLDRKALPEPDFTGTGRSRFRAPTNPMEELIVAVFSDILGIDAVSVDDSFFDLGGNSLVATRAVSRINAALNSEITVRDLFEYATPSGLAQRAELHSLGGRTRLKLEAKPRPDIIPLSHAQQRIWFLNQYDTSSPAYNVPMAVDLIGDLDSAAVAQAMKDIVERHESLRTTFPLGDNGAYQVIHNVDDSVPELAPRPVKDIDELTVEITALAAEGFDVTKQLPLRCALFRRDARHHTLVLVVHHISADGFSLQPLARDFVQAYTNRAAKAEPDWAPLEVQYADFALWQQEYLGSETDPTSILAQQFEYWRETLSGTPELLELPTDRPRPAVQSLRGADYQFSVPAELHSKLRSISADSSSTLFMVVHSALAALLSRLSGSDDITIGTPVAGRGEAALDDLVGMFVNTLVLRTSVDWNSDFASLLAQAKSVDIGAFSHADVPFERLVEELAPQRSTAHPPLFQVMLEFQNLGEARVELPGLDVHVRPLGTATAKFDMQVILTEQFDDDGAPGLMNASITYASDIFEHATIARLAQQFVRVLEQVTERPELPIGDLALMDDSERRRLLYSLNDTAVSVDATTLTDVFAQQVQRTPEAPAIEYAGKTLTYAEFDAITNAGARQLIELGAGPDTHVALVMRRSLEMLVGMYSIVKSGAAYVPVDPDNPAERNQYVLDLAKPICALVSDRADFTPDNGTRVIVIGDSAVDGYSTGPITDSDRHQPLRPDNPAYVIFTSGSTGRPKGVSVPHRGIANRLAWMQNEYHLTAYDVVLQKTPYTFDVSVWEFFWPLQVGARLVIAKPDGHRDPAYLAELIHSAGVTTLHFVPSMLATFASALSAEQRRIMSSVRQVFCSGEALPPAVTEDFRALSDAKIHNLYGPTEASVDVTYHEYTPDDRVAVPIGAPVWNTEVFVLDSRLRPTPIGVPGELYLAGVQLARGYVERGDLTADRFVANPYGDAGQRMYRTGDLVRWRVMADGRTELDYIGRTDFQVKLRGLRIELPEIEAVLLDSADVAQAVVVVHRDDVTGDRLIAYVVPSGPSLDVPQLLAATADALPAYMVPSQVVVLDEFPLGATGKLDRKALVVPEWVAADSEFVAPRSPIEQIIGGVFAELLGLDRVSVQASFFDIGGNSLIAARLIARVNNALGSNLGVRDLFDAPSVAALAVRAEGGSGRTRPRITSIERPEVVPVSLAQQRMWFINQLDKHSAAYNSPLPVRLTGKVDDRALELALRDVVERHETLRTVYPESADGPIQVVMSADDVKIDLTPVQVDDESDMQARAAAFAFEGFDVAADIPLRARLFRINPTEHVLLVVVHHISSDGFSLAPLARDVVVAYTARAAGLAPDWKPLPVQYTDFAVWQRDLLGDEGDDGSLLASQLGYWERTLAGVPDVLELPVDKPRPAKQSLHGAVEELEISAELHQRIIDLSRAHNTSVFMVMHAAIALLLAKLSGTQDIAVGTPIAGRGEAELDDLVGMFVNTLVLRTHVDLDETFVDLVNQARTVDLGAFSNADVPFERVVDQLSPHRSEAHSPLFQVMVEFQNNEKPRLDLPDLSVDFVEIPIEIANFDLQFVLSEKYDGGPAGISAGIRYATDLFTAQTVRGVAERFVMLLDNATRDPHLPVSRIDILTPEERAEITSITGGPGNRIEVLPDLLTMGIRDYDAPAVIDGDKQITYRELDELSNKIARILIEDGVTTENFVAMGFSRSIEWLVSLWSVTKAGGAFVPVDPTYPRDRIEHMLTDSGAVAGLSLSANRDSLTDLVPWMFLDSPEFQDRLARTSAAPIADADRRAPILLENAAYLIYTSGSTGKPKGVVVTHRGLDNFTPAMVAHPSVTQHSRVLSFASPSFDASLLEVLMAFGAGASIVIVPPHVYGGEELTAVIRDHRVTHGFITPLGLASVDREQVDHFEFVVVGGEAVPQELVNEWAHGRNLYNGYGPTEATIVATLSDAMQPGQPVRIGRLFNGVTAVVLDTRLQPVPKGVAGELYISGLGLGRGYHERFDLTSNRFVANPYGEIGERMYRTGDVVRWVDDYQLEYLGRSDFQVKVRGFRIELGEIDSALLSHGSLNFAATLGKTSPSGATMLVSYVRAAEGHVVDTDALTEHIAEFLPAYMVPSVIMEIDVIPLAVTGKLDRKALPEPDFTLSSTEFRAPTNPIEETLVGIFADVLALERVSIDDNFFDVGGNSLIATRVVARANMALGTKIGVRELFDAPTVAELATRISGHSRQTDNRPPLVPQERPDNIPLSSAQQRMWFINQFDTASAAYNVPMAIRLSGQLNLPVLNTAIQDVVSRHESLRTVFPSVGDTPAQVILPPGEMVFALKPIDTAGHDLVRTIEQYVAQGFDVTKDVPVRAQLLRLAPDEHVLVIVVHHIAADGFSMSPLATDVMVAYHARLHGDNPSWAPLPVQYADFAIWQRKILGEESDPTSALAQQTEFWKRTLAGLPDVVDLPADRPRPLNASLHGGLVRFDIDAETHRALADIGRANGATMFMVMHAALALLVSRLSGKDDLAIGTPVAGRGEAELDGIVGMFVNTLVLRTEIDQNVPFAGFLNQVKDVDLAAFTHADVAFERLVEILRPDRSTAHSPLFQVLIEFQNNPEARLELPDLTVEPVKFEDHVSKFDLQLSVRENATAEGNPNGIEAGFIFATDLFDEDTVRSFADRFQRILQSVLREPGTPVGDIALLSDAEQSTMLTAWNHPGVHISESTLVDVFTRQALTFADRAAVTSELDDVRTVLSYRELDARSNQLARKLIASGAGPEKLVAVAAPRDADLIVALLAVVKSGAGYLPIDVSYPADRIEFMLADGAPVSVLTTRSEQAVLPAVSAELIYLDDDISNLSAEPITDADRLAPLSWDNTAYVIYTSGSTGTPKGVTVPHRTVLTLFANTHAKFNFDENDVWTMFHSYAFDFSVWELWGPLLYGGRLVVVDYFTARSPEQFHGLLVREGVTVLNQTPSAFYQLAETDRLAETADDSLALRYVIFGGEALDLAQLDRWYTRHNDTAPRLVNMYGITETTVHVTYLELDREFAANASASVIGQALPGLQVKVLDARLRPVAPGTIGEMYVSGPQLSRGYLGRPDLTAGRFVADPYGAPGEAMYRSGDLARWNKNGQLEYLGRSDFQVQLRGFRIELGEIEAALLRYPGVAQSAVLMRADTGPGSERLVGYVVPQMGLELQPQEIIDALSETLAAHMVPSAVLILDSFPLTANGKLDRRELPAPDFSALVTESRAPATPIEEKLAEVFAQVLGLDTVGVDDSFFALGGDSIMSIQLVTRAKAAGIHISPRDVFNLRTVAALAQSAVLSDGEDEIVLNELPGGGVGRMPLTPVMEWMLERGGEYNRYAQCAMLTLPGTIDAAGIEATLQAVIDHHDLLRAQLDGHELVVAEPGAVSASSLITRVDVEADPGTAEFTAIAERALDDAADLLDPHGGVMLRAVWLAPRSGVAGRIILAIHHIAVDGVTWRVLVPDLATAWNHIASGQEIKLEANSTSFRRWAHGLAENAASRESELDVWRGFLAGQEPNLGSRAFDPTIDTNGTVERIDVTVPTDVTDALLTRVPEAFHGGVNDGLLAALALALAKWRGATTPLVGLEGHGREETAVPGADLSRTLGWFTTIVPIRFNTDGINLDEAFAGGAATGAVIKRVKELLRSLPDNGIGFGQLRYLNPSTADELRPISRPQVSFNYLGRFTTGEISDDLRALGWLPVGDNEDVSNLSARQNDDMAAMAVLDINTVTSATASGPVLRGTIGFPTGLLTQAEVEEFATLWRDALIAIAKHVSQPDAGGLTPSDLDLVQLDQTAIDRFEQHYPSISDVWPLAPLQSGLLFHAVLAEETVDAYMVQLVLHLRGTVDANRMRRTLHSLLVRYPNLRVAYAVDNSGQAVQVVVDDVALPFTEVDLAGEDDKDSALQRVLADDHQRQFDMAAPPLIRFMLINLGGGEYRFVITNHHILLDGWSTPLLLTDLVGLYLLDGDATMLPPVRSYRDYLAWLSNTDPQASLRAWVDAFAGVDEPTTIAPLDRSRQHDVASQELIFDFTVAESEEFAALAKNLGVTLNTMVQTAWAVALSTITSRDDVVFGTTVSGRPPHISGVEKMVGLFINTLPVRVRLDPTETLTELLTRIQREQADMLDHHYVQLADIQREVGAGAAFDTLAVFESYPVDTAGATEDTDLAGMRIVGFDGVDAAHYPITLVAYVDDALHLKLKYFPDLFGAADMVALQERLAKIMKQILAEPSKPYAQVDVLTAHERSALVPVAGPPGVTTRTLAQILTDAASSNPDRIAVIDGDRQISYRELDERSNQLARVLISRGVRPEAFVALGISRSIESILGIWAVTKTGGAYVPVDPTYPRDRIEHMLTDSGAAFGITTSRRLNTLPGEIPWIALDSDEFKNEVLAQSTAPISADELRGQVYIDSAAYIIYTSGSTGKPKGVLATHRGLENFSIAAQSRYGTTGDSRVMHFSSPSFDASVLEFLYAFGAHATMVIIPPEIYGGDELATILKDKRVTHGFITPLALGSMDPAGLEELRNVTVGGEAVPESVVETWAPGRNLYNGYGPTETTIMVLVSAPMTAEGPVRLGGVLRATELVVLDSRLQPVPIGAAGELYVSGLGLTRGYHDRSGLTAERFIASPFGEAGQRMYRTGDVVRWVPSATGDELELEYVGRSDFQVKVRGFRIELGEIDAVLGAHSSVGVAVTVGHQRANGQTMLVSYVSPRDGAVIDTAVLTEHASQSLPSHMVPSLIIPLDEMPRTPVGKVDRKALPSPDMAALEPEYVGPRNPVEEAIAGIFAEVLGDDRVSVIANFFDLGGNSLVATRVIARINDALGTALGVRELFEAPTVESLAVRVEHAGEALSDRAPLQPQERPVHVPVSLAQQRMWFINQFDTASPAYNVPLAVRLTGDLDVAAFSAALRDVIERHEALRTVFPRSEEGPSQVIVPSEEVVPDLIPQDVADEAELRKRIIRIAGTGFDVQAEVPVRARLFRKSRTEYVLVVVVHHIAADGFSMGPLARDIVTAYHARCNGQQPGWKPLAVQYADYTLWQRTVLGDDTDTNSVAYSQVEYWKRTLAGLPDVIELPTDRPRPAQQTLRGDDVRFTIPAELHQNVEQLARRHGATPFMVLHAALAVLLSRLSGTSDIAIGTPIAGRGEAALDDLVGMFVNTLVLRTQVDGDQSFEGLLTQAKEVDLEAFGQADVPFERLVEVLKPERSTAHAPLFQATIEFQNLGNVSVELDGVRVEPLEFPTAVAKYDLELILAGDGSAHGDLEAAFTYATDLFDASTVREFADRFLRILQVVVAEPTCKVGDINLLSTDERDRFAPVHGPEGLLPQSLPAILEAAAERNPDATGVEFGETSLTYRQLDEQSNKIARALIALGAGPEKVVALGLSRSLESVLSVWAVAKTGAAFVPVDPNYPPERIEHMLTDSGAVAGVTISTHRTTLTNVVTWLQLDDAPTAAAIASQSSAPITDAERTQPLQLGNPAYLIYTSGSTGLPKGVEVTHYGLASLAAEERDHLVVTPESRVLHSASPSFDASVFEMLMAYGSAASLVVAPPSVYGGRDMAELLKDKAITHAFFTPAVLASVEDDGIDELQSILVAGDVCPPELVARWAPGRSMVNAYGPTETTIMSSITAPMQVGEPITIGATTRGFSALVLDARLQPVPAGVAGELYLAGPALARGYRGRLGLTSERFVANPFGEPGERMYRTGDVVRWVDRGPQPELEFVGRSDFQVKVRGLRIELGEIDTALAGHPNVSFATTTGHQRANGDTLLVSYVLLHEGETATPEELTAYLGEFLPGYMVPSVIMLLDQVPLTPVGKLDRKALPAPDLESLRKEFVAPRSELEQAVADAFAYVLGIERVSAFDSFFDLGGNSLSVTTLVGALEKSTGRTIRLQAVFLNPTPAGLAERMQRPDEAPSELAGQLLAPVIRLRPHGRKAPLFCVHPGVGLSWAYTGLTAHIPEDHPVFGLQLPSLTGAQPAESIEVLAEDYIRHIRDIQPQGPYHLLGWSLGGVIAQEMAVQLREAGEEVVTLALLDSYVVAETEVPGIGELVRSFGVDLPASDEITYEDAASLIDDAFGQPTGLTAMHMERIHGGFADAARILTEFTPKEFDGELVFFSAENTVDPSGNERTPQEWEAITTGELVVHEVPVTHQQMVEPAALDIIGPLLARHISAQS